MVRLLPADPFVPCLAKDIHVTPLLIRLLADPPTSRGGMKGKLGEGEGKNVSPYTDLGLKDIETQIFSQ